jgi:hypothetical protein
MATKTRQTFYAAQCRPDGAKVGMNLFLARTPERANEHIECHKRVKDCKREHLVVAI